MLSVGTVDFEVLRHSKRCAKRRNGYSKLSLHSKKQRSPPRRFLHAVAARPRLEVDGDALADSEEVVEADLVAGPEGEN